jgi:hypothetical protein
MSRTDSSTIDHARIAEVISRVVGSFVARGQLRSDEADDVRSTVTLRVLRQFEEGIGDLRSVDDYVARMAINAATDVLRGPVSMAVDGARHAARAPRRGPRIRPAAHRIDRVGRELMKRRHVVSLQERNEAVDQLRILRSGRGCNGKSEEAGDEERSDEGHEAQCNGC